MRSLKWVLGLSVLMASTAGATPVQLTTSGHVVDAAGTPINGPTTLVVELFGALTGGAPAYTESFASVPISDGYFTAILGQDTAGHPLDHSVLDTTPLYVQTTAGGVVLTPRQPVGAAPVAVSVRGGTADVASLKVGGVAVVDGSRNLTAQGVTAASLTVAGNPVVDAAGTLNLSGMFTRITARATVGSTGPVTWTGATSCPAGTTLINWGTQQSVQFWGGGMSHWYATCAALAGNTGVQANLYTQSGYVGHYLECWGLCMKVQ